MSATPDGESAPNPRNDGNHEDHSPEPPEIPRFIVRWFRGFHLHREKPKVTDYLTVGLTLGVAIAAFWSACIFQGQLTEARKQTQRSTDSFRIDERAWIGIEPIKPILLMPNMTPDTGAAFTCDIYPKNFGKTAATDILVRATDVISTDGWDENAQVVSKSQDKIPIEIPSSRVPRVLAPSETAAAPFRLTCQAPQTFKSGHQMIHYLIGRIDYIDQFRIAHWKKFCYFVVNNRGEIWNCQEGNDEDRNPETPPGY
jgi:hypothetical protein